MIPGFGFSPMSDNLLFCRNWFPDWVKGRDLPVNRMEMVILKLAKMPADGEVQFQTQTVLRYRGVKFCTCKLILQAYYFTTTAFIVIWIILGKYAASTLSFINRQTVFAATTELVRNLTTWSGCSCSFCQGWYGNTTNLCRTFCASAVLKDRKRRREEGEESSGPWGQPLTSESSGLQAARKCPCAFGADVFTVAGPDAFSTTETSKCLECAAASGLICYHSPLVFSTNHPKNDCQSNTWKFTECISRGTPCSNA
jgi:hypothetical protein